MMVTNGHSDESVTCQESTGRASLSIADQIAKLPFQVKRTVLCFHGPLMYESRILRVEMRIIGAWYINQKISFVRFAHPGPSAGVLQRVRNSGFKVTSYNLDSIDYSFKGFTSDIAIDKVINSFSFMLDSIVAPARGSFVTI